MRKVALITGISGQDGSYLAELLLSKGYDVWGMIRRNSSVNNKVLLRINPILDKVRLEYGDMTDMGSLSSILGKCRPTEIYNLAAQSHVRISFDNPILTMNINSVGVLNLLENVRTMLPGTRVYQAGSSEMFGNSVDGDGFQRETTPMAPVSPYATSKLCAHNLMRNYREAYGMHLVNGMLFNHESPRRGENFLSQKVAKAGVEISLGKRDGLVLGNLKAYRDWGHAKDYVKAMHLMMQQDVPGDYVCAMGEVHSVQELVEYVFGRLGLDWRRHVGHDDIYERATELHYLKGDASRLRALGWSPTYTFGSMLDEMMDHWMFALKD